jgi:hypothetical protein
LSSKSSVSLFGGAVEVLSFSGSERFCKPRVGIKLLAGSFSKREYQNCLSYIGQRFHKSLINLDKLWRNISRELLILLMFCRLAKARVGGYSFSAQAFRQETAYSIGSTFATTVLPQHQKPGASNSILNRIISKFFLRLDSGGHRQFHLDYNS